MLRLNKLLYIKNSLVAFIAITICLGCNNPKTTHNVQPVITLPAYFYKRLEGTIDGKQTTMHLERAGNIASGRCYYDKQWLKLTPLKNDKNQYLTFALSNYLESDSEQADNTLKLSLAWHGNYFDGTLKNQFGFDGDDINLREKYPAGSYKFEVSNYSDSIAAIANISKSPKAKFSITYLKPVADDEHAKWLDEQLKTLGQAVDLKESREIIYKDLSKKYFAQCRDRLMDYTNKDGSIIPSIPNFFDIKTQYIVFNNNNYVNLELFSEQFNGGSGKHFGSLMYCYDVKNKQRMAMTDILNIDFDSMQKLLRETYVKMYHYAPRNSAEKMQFEQTSYQTDNFYFNQFGLAIMNNSGWIPGNFEGQVLLFIQFTDLKSYLKADFKRRMGLSNVVD